MDAEPQDSDFEMEQDPFENLTLEAKQQEDLIAYMRKRLGNADFEILSLALGLEGTQKSRQDIADLLNVSTRTVTRSLSNSYNCLKNSQFRDILN
jgi:DNA-directed RNA polymerase specialized sigma subunit